MGRKWVALVVEMYVPATYAKKVEHFDSSMEIARLVGEIPEYCVLSIAKQLGVEDLDLGKLARIVITFESLTSVNYDVLDEACRSILSEVLRLASPNSKVVFEGKSF